MHIKDIFFESDDDSNAPKPSSAGKSSQTPSSVPSMPEGHTENGGDNLSFKTSQAAASVGSGVDEYIKFFKNVMKEHPASAKGPNYYEFITALEKMKTKAMDDKTKYESVFTGFDVLGVTPKFLVDSARQYQNIFASKKIDFENAVNQSISQNVEAKKSQIQSLKTKNKGIDDQMLSLNQQKLANEDSIQKLTSEIAKASTKIESNKADFSTAFEQVNQDIENNIQKISQYLGDSNSGNS